MVNDLYDRLQKIIDKVKTEKFIEGRGLGNEISYYIFDYDPKEELVVREYVQYIKKQLNKLDSNRKVIEFDLYKIFIELLKEEDVFEKIVSLEKESGKEYVLNAVTPFITSGMFAEKIARESEGYDLIFLTGIGKVYPFMRSHNILNSLQQFLNKRPLVLFYPGNYSGQDLTLFNLFKDENYYRAFPLVTDK
ncbi:DUF1788 domain-containing protein [Clostridium estertheticum]|uniref:DUF1788 domain-containing protein n=1 Tax=Clostridium estertheticum TaxID=238834 RepID=UPI0013E972CB|nr:DUF1788 domain-containing protein [Clostridium estertheticum]MBZ9684971.1 DUF1788 domain-containing protein [Clostridium estertheticum]